MQRTLILAAVATLGLFGLVAASSTPKAPASCTWIGTAERDVKTGGAGRNVLCSLAGNDFVHARAGDDVIRAGRGRDTAVGGDGRDVVRGGGGRDRLVIVDDHGGELVVGGPGQDQCFADVGDRVIGCERTFRSNEPEMAAALGDSLATVMGIVEELVVTPTLTLPPPVPGPPGPTGPIGPPGDFPPCTPPPGTPPPPIC